MSELEISALLVEPLEGVFCLLSILLIIAAFAVEAHHTIDGAMGIYCFESFCLLQGSIAEPKTRLLSPLVVFRYSTRRAIALSNL